MLGTNKVVVVVVVVDSARKENLHFDDQCKEVVVVSSRNSLKETENTLSVFLSSLSINLLAFYHECCVIETLVEVWEKSKNLCSDSISRSPKCPLVLLLNHKIMSSRFLSRDS